MMRNFTQSPVRSGAVSRRGVLAAALGSAVIALIAPLPALALDANAAKAHVQVTIDEVLALVQAAGNQGVKPKDFRALLEKRTAMPQIARFAAGPLWREMSDAQQSSYTGAFSHYVSTIYAARFQEYSGQTVDIGGANDRGKRGIEIASTVSGGGQVQVKVDWLVSDRPGRTVIADITIEGVSLLITQREEIAGIHRKQGSIDAMIDFLSSV